MKTVYSLSFIVYRWVVLVCSVLTISSCNKSQKIPSNVLTQDKMQAVVWDMMRADQFLGDFVFAYDTTANKDSQSIRLYQQVLAIHKLSKEDFNRSWKYYKDHPALMQIIMDSIGRKQVNGPSVVNAIPDTALPVTPTKKFVPRPDTILRKRNKKDLQVQ